MRRCRVRACTHTRPRPRACVHFHRRARRKCKVAYMQGVKLGSRRFDPRPRIERYRSVATEFLQRRERTTLRAVWIRTWFRHRIFVVSVRRASHPRFGDSYLILDTSDRRGRIIRSENDNFRFRSAELSMIIEVFLHFYPSWTPLTNIPRDKLNLRRNSRHSHS